MRRRFQSRVFEMSQLGEQFAARPGHDFSRLYHGAVGCAFLGGRTYLYLGVQQGDG